MNNEFGRIQSYLPLLFIVFLFGLSACVTFRNPLPLSENLSEHSALRGIWMSTEDGSYIVVEGQNEEHFDIAILDYHRKSFNISLARAYPASGFKSKLLTLEPVSVLQDGVLEDVSSTGFIFLKYMISNGELLLWGINTSKLEEALIKKKLSSNVDYEKCLQETQSNSKRVGGCGTFRHIIVLDSSEKLRSFFQSSEGDSVFDKIGRWKQLK